MSGLNAQEHFISYICNLPLMFSKCLRGSITLKLLFAQLCKSWLTLNVQVNQKRISKKDYSDLD
jgi:hypothetical protein